MHGIPESTIRGFEIKIPKFYPLLITNCETKYDLKINFIFFPLCPMRKEHENLYMLVYVCNSIYTEQILSTNKKLRTLLDIENSHVSVMILFLLLQDIRAFIQTKFFSCIEFKDIPFYKNPASQLV